MFRELSQPYGTGVKAARELLAAYPGLSPEDVFQEAALLVCEALHKGRLVKRKFVLGNLRHRFVIGPARERRKLRDFAIGLNPVREASRATLTVHPRCALPGHTERRHGNCWKCKLARDARWRQRRNANA